MTTPSKDIADFYVNVRDAKNKILAEHHLAYDTRSIDIKGDDISADYENGLQICVLAKNSDGTIGSWFDSQCYNLPTDFESIKRKYAPGYHAVYEILSSKKNRRNKLAAGGRGGASSNGCALRQSFAISSMFLFAIAGKTLFKMLK